MVCSNKILFFKTAFSLETGFPTPRGQLYIKIRAVTLETLIIPFGNKVRDSYILFFRKSVTAIIALKFNYRFLQASQTRETVEGITN